MKKLIIAALLTACTTAAFANDLPSIIFEGKVISPTDTRASLTKKLGKPKTGNQTYSHWEKSNYSMSASYSKDGLEDFGISQLKTTPANVQLKVNGQTITMGKDTINTAIKKLKYGCFDIVDTQFNNNYSFIASSGFYDDYRIVMDAEYVGGSKSKSANQPIFGFKMTTEAVDASEGCNY